jgi:Gpi18-like mannosyltransferase
VKEVSTQTSQSSENVLEPNSKLSLKKGFSIVCSVAFVTLFLKLTLSYLVYGTNDITYWQYFLEVIMGSGSFKIYSLVGFYNHPPLMSWILPVLAHISKISGLSFPFVFRLMPIIADFFCVLVIWELLSAEKIKMRILLCVLCSINPVNFLISGFHGNTDPVFIFLVFLTIYFIEKKNIVGAGLGYGLSLCVKIVPIIVLPVFFFYFRDKKDRVRFLFYSALIPLLVFLPYLLIDFHSVTKNIFAYGSQPGIWGIPFLLNNIFNNSGMNPKASGFSYDIFLAYNNYGKVILLFLIFGLSGFLMARRNAGLIEGCFSVFAVFLSFTVGFGVQYLAWLSYFAILVMPRLSVVYLVIGEIFLIRIYSFWGARIPPYYANADAVGPWIGFDKVIGLFLWVIVVIMLIKVLSRFITVSEKRLEEKPVI